MARTLGNMGLEKLTLQFKGSEVFFGGVEKTDKEAPESISDFNSMKKSPKDWVKLAGIGLVAHIVLTCLGIGLVKLDWMTNEVLALLALVSMPGMLAIIYHVISVIWGVAIGEYGNSRPLKLAGIFFLGPIVTVYLAWNYEKWK